MVGNSQARRVAQLEADSVAYSLIEENDYNWSKDDEEFFAMMFARALSGDRNWSREQEARYHALLLNETSEPMA